MFKSARSRLRAAVFACAAALGLGAYAATPVAVWDGDFNVTEKNGVTFYANGNTVAEDGSTVTISSDATVAPYVILPKTYRYTSIAFTVSNLSEGTDKLVVLFGAGSTPNATGVYLSGAEGLTTSGVNWGGKWNTTTYDGTLTTGAGDRTFVATYDSGENGTHLYEAGTGSSDPIFGGGGNNNLRYANTMCDTIAIGGGKSVLTGLTPLTGLVIKKIAVYTSTSAIPVAQSEIAAYAIPAATTIAVPAKMSAFNEEVANATGVINITGTETAVELDVEPSDAAKAILQNADVWRGTVLIKDTDKNAIVPTAYGNPNSTLKLSGVKGYFAKAQYAATVTPAIELEDSTTEGREYGLWQYDGFSYNAKGDWAYVATPELKGSGTLKCDKDVRPLLLVGKWSAFTGTLNLSAGGAVWFGLDVPAQDSALVTSAMVKFNGALPSGIAGWTYAKASGTVTQTAIANSDQVAFFTNSKWTGTCKIQFGHNGNAFDVVNYGNAGSVIEIAQAFSAYPTKNGGKAAPNLAAELKLSANWTVANGWDNQTTTFAKLSGTGSLIVNGTSSGSSAIPYTITKIENFTGALGGARGKFTIGTIVASSEPTPGAKLVNCTTANAPVLDDTKVTYNGAEQDVALEFKAGDGIYVAVPATVDVTVPVVDNTTVTVTADGVAVSPTTEGGTTYSVASGAAVVVTYTATEGYKLEGTGVFNFTASDGYSVDVSSTASNAIVARTDDDQTFTRVSDALTYAYMTTGVEVVTVIDSTWTDDGTYDEYFAWDATARTYTKRLFVARIGAVSFTSLAAAIAYEGAVDPIVVLLADVTLDATVVVTNSLTLDLNGHDIAATDARALWIKAGTVSITGEGVVSANGNGLGETSSVIRVGDGATNANAAGLTIGASVAVESAKCYGVTAFGKNTPGITLVVNGTVAVTSSGEADAAISGNGSPGLAETYITINSGATVTSANSAAIYNPGAGTLTVNGGTITGKHGIVARAGSVAVNGGTITATGTAQDAETIGDSANVIPCAAIAYDAGANYPGFDDGTAIAVTGGTFTSNVDSIDTTGEPTVAVSGGEFSSAVPAEYCAEGYEPKDNGDGTYGVRVDKGWIYEDADFPNYTGSWSKDGAALDLAYDSETGKAAIEDGATYTASKPSAGQFVTINLALSFDGVNDDEDGYEGAKAAIRLGAGDTEGTYVFQLYTTNETGTAAWLVATASGVTPAVETDYEFTFVLDMTNKTFTATVDGVALTVDGAETLGFASANASDTVQSIEFTGSGKVTSITGSYEGIPVPEGFAEDDTFGDVTLTAAQAEWLNGQGNYDALAAKIATMDATAFNNAYLLNLDILDESYQDYQEGDFVVTDFAFETESETEYVVVEVTLERHGALDGGINGTLKLTGAMQLGGQFETKASATISDDDFSEGNTATLKLEKSGALFYKPVIE
ncbi:MAG: hypothetical protein J6Q49_03690 [Kiritimatiellae bacterium]|nr:hypothetical protein [Kiritimatiellia bacterium]